MAVSIPPAGTPADEAFLSQGPAPATATAPSPYPGVDKWVHPRKDLPPGIILAQFDFRSKADIMHVAGTVSTFFTDLETIQKFTTPDGKLQARELAEALQVRPFRLTDVGPHLYSQNVAVYEVIRQIDARNVQRTQLAEFGHGQTRNNIQYGSGVGRQYYLPEAAHGILSGPSPALKIVQVLPCIHREHRLDWLEKLENDGAGNRQVLESISSIFDHKVQDLLKGTAQQQQHGEHIKTLYQANAQAKNLLMPGLAPKVPSLTPGPVTGPAPRHKRGPHF